MSRKYNLSDRLISALPVPERGQRDYWDSKIASFGLRVSRGGSKTFILNISNSRRALGHYPIISLAQARTEAKRILAEQTLGRLRPEPVSFPQAFSMFIEDREKFRRPSTIKAYRRLLAKHLVFKGPVASLSHAEMSRRLSQIKAPSEYNHALAASKSFFNWCMKRRLCTENPTMGLSPYRRDSRTRVLSDTELKAIWHASNSKELPAPFRTIVKLLILLGQRRGETSALRGEYFGNRPYIEERRGYGEPSWGIRRANTILCTITLPSNLTKNHREHTLPIGRLTQSILSQRPTTGLLFLAKGTLDQPFNGWSKSKDILDRISGVQDWTLHDLRRTFATRLAELGVPPHIIERLLNHVTGSMTFIAQVYNRAKYLGEMREAIDLWEAYLSDVLSVPVAKIVPEAEPVHAW